MKKRIKKIIMTSWAFLCVIFCSKITVGASELEHLVYRNIPKEVIMIANNSYEQMIQAVIYKHEEFGLGIKDLQNVSLGDPFVIFEDKNNQDEIYYFPILSRNNIVMVLSVTGTTEGWGLSLSTEYVEVLNEINFDKDYYLLYKVNDVLLAKSYNKNYAILEDEDIKMIRINPSTYMDLQEENVENKMSSLKKFNVKMVNMLKCTKAKYSPGYSTSTSTAKIALLNNAQGQGPYGLCWAASVATVTNYIYGTNYTAKNVADAQGIDYEVGAKPTEMQKALEYYTITYQVTDEQLSYSSVKKNIQNKKLPIIYAQNEEEQAHAVTLYGYGGNYVYIWNSGLNYNEGGSQLIAYKSSGTTFPFGNTTFKWKQTIHATK